MTGFVFLSLGACVRKLLVLLLLAMALLGIGAAGAVEVTVTVKPDGSFEPQWVRIRDGDTVAWRLPIPGLPPGTIGKTFTTHAIIPVRPTLQPQQVPGLDICADYKRYDPGDPNEFTGPMPAGASGIFALGPMGSGAMWSGFEEKSGRRDCDACKADKTLELEVQTEAGVRCLCETGEPYATMKDTWQDPDITGVLIRMEWNAVHTGPGRFDWTALDREIGRAVGNGKLYSLVFRAGKHGTPDWIFHPEIDMPSPGAPTRQRLPAVRRLHFKDGGSNLEADRCGSDMDLGSPADEAYRRYYFELLREVAEHVKTKNAWYRALASIKPSGMNLFTDENRLPKRCETASDCPCNTETWATAAEVGYTPTKLREFYQKQMEVLAESYPGKDMSYMLIQDGFPQVNDSRQYLGQPGLDIWDAEDIKARGGNPCEFPPKGTLPSGAQQTECVLQDGASTYGTRFVVQHNALKPQCGDNDNDGIEDCRPNRWTRQAGSDGQIVGFQTTNATNGVDSPEHLEAALQNGYCDSQATFFEIYEQRLWEIRKTRSDGVLDAHARTPAGCVLPGGPRTLGDWDNLLHIRRRERGVTLKLPDAFPTVHRHQFTRTLKTNEEQRFTYVNGHQCGEGSTPKYGVVAILAQPWVVTTQSAAAHITPVSGFDVLGPSHKPIPATVSSQSRVTSDKRIALSGISLGEDEEVPCSLSLSFQDLPGQPNINASLPLTTTLSGSGACRPAAASTRTAAFTAPHFVRGISVCTSGTIPQVRGIRIDAATVNKDGTVSKAAEPSKTVTLGGCDSWQPARNCPTDHIAVGVRAYFTAAGGFTGLALQCKALDAR